MKINTFLIFITVASHLFGQLDSTRLNQNNVSAFISDAGTFFYDFHNQKKGYEIPSGSGVHALKGMQLWFAAKDTNGQILFSQGGVPEQGNDIFNGPISNPGTYSSQEYINSWSKPIWTICQSTIDNFTLNHNCSQDPNCSDYYPITNKEMDQISNWPAHGDVSLGQSFYLAPYTDHGDGVYNPSQGDIPSIKGCCAAYIIQNDKANLHTLTNTDPIGIELHIMFYQYNSSDYLNNVTFVDVKAINHSGQDYPKFIHSVAIKAALGNETDDFFGSDSLSNMMYFYNADNNDEANSTSLGYGQNPPAIGIVGLNKDMTACVPYSGNETVAEKWNLMEGFQTNGNPWLHPNGFDTKYIYSGRPSNATQWSEFALGNTPGNARGLFSINFGNFNNGDTLSQSYAIVYARDGNHLYNVESLIDNAVNVKSFFDEPCSDGTTGLEDNKISTVTISPNPTKNFVKVFIDNNNGVPKKMKLLSITGKTIKETTSNTFDLSNCDNGIYFVWVEFGKSNVIKKIIKN